jgi:hypothetical protein
LTKDEVERLLRHGAYDIFNEEKAGSADAESNDFIQQDIDSILERRSRKVVHGNTGSQSNAAGGTFSKASFKAAKSPDGKKGSTEDVDIEDPEFWTKMVGEAPPEEASELKPRKRQRTNYSENLYGRQIDEALSYGGGNASAANASAANASGADSSEYSSDDEDDDGSDEEGSGSPDRERTRWGGSHPNQWKRDQADCVFKALEIYGYGNFSWDAFCGKLSKCNMHSQDEVCIETAWIWICRLLALLTTDSPYSSTFLICFRSSACAGRSCYWGFARVRKMMLPGIRNGRRKQQKRSVSRKTERLLKVACLPSLTRRRKSQLLSKK